MTSSSFRRLLLVLAFACVACPAGTAWGQGTTASITGTVIDDTGEPLPGVNVIAVHEPTGTRYGAATKTNGRYTLLNVRVGGPYSVRASFVGYQTVERSGLQLALEEKRVLDFELRPKTEELDEIEVIAERAGIISRTRTGALTNVSEEQIDRLPTISRSFSDFTRLTPQASGNGNIMGRNNRYNAIQIDGATINDVFGLGNTPGEQAGTQPISIDAIKEFNVNVAPYDVRSSGFTGGQVNAVTKSGTNQFEGLVRYRLGTEGFTGDLDGLGTNDFEQQFFVGNLGGPILKDELFFFVNAEVKRENTPDAIRIADGGGTNTFSLDQSVLDRIGVGSTREALNSIADASNDVYGYDPGTLDAVTEEENNVKIFAKLDWNATDNHRLTLRHSYVTASNDENLSRSTSGFDFASQLYRFESVQNSTVAQVNSTFGDNLFNEARLVYTRIADKRDSESPFPQVEFDFGDDGVDLGVGRFNQANSLTQNLVEFTNDVTYVRGDHTITGGLQFNVYDFQNLFIQDFYGSYVFESFTVGDSTVSAVEAFRRGQPVEYQYSYATPAAPSSKPDAAFTAYQAGLYVQDEWQVSDAFRLTAGLRVEAPFIPQEPTENPAADSVFGFSTSTVASGNLLWSPRVGFNYSAGFFGDDFETQLRGGAGLFAGRPPYVFISNQYSNTGADLFRIDAGFTPSDTYVGEDGSYDRTVRIMPTSSADTPSDQPRPGEVAGLQPVETTEINLIDDDFKYPQVFRTNLAVDQQLPLSLTATLEGIFSQSINEVVYRNLNIEQTGTSRYGRPIYGGTVSNQFTNAILLENANNGFEYSATAQVQRRAPEGLNGQLAYTYTHAENVNNATSDRAISNWQFNENFDVNDPRLGRADFEVTHRILGEVNYRFSYLDRFATTVGLIYEGRSGERFSWIYNGNANSDTQDENDLVYVPAEATDVVLQSENWELLDAFIRSEDALREARGEVIDRNTAHAPWQNLLDLRVSQEIETIRNQRIEVVLDVKNVLNLVGGWVGEEDWGRIYETSFNNRFAWDFSRYVNENDVGTRLGGRVLTTDDIGKPVISFSEETVRETLTQDIYNVNNIGSRWRLRLGVRYTF